LAARDFSRAGETFIDHNSQVNEILYATLTPLGYQAYVSVHALQHADFDKRVSLFTRWIQMEKMEIRLFSGVVEFIFGPSKRIVYGDEGQPGLEIGRNKKSGKIVAFMSLDFPEIYHWILKGLKEKPIPGRFSVESVEGYGKITSICDPRVKNATFAEIVQWVWEKYYAHLEQDVAGGARA
jgi:hypothetical protein